ncbi:Oxidoreductase family, NAD-binding Rossmann fold [Popillia japonica]|uniref:Trans-1,2-dihydrobenzene-1,2-diol dehydrogenase n=2 Tax=Popillia japonica TaxID=7064 RepID=A0AAW1IAQ3_POPJA
MALRWGIASAGKISHDFVAAIHTLPANNHEVIAVAARSCDIASKFAQIHKIPKYYEGYESLAMDNDVDVVYIGAIHPKHYSITKMMLENGKHVLCEKPFTMNEHQTSELLQLAKMKKLFLMEAVWSRCFPIYYQLEQEIEAGTIGDVIYINACLGFPLQDVPRCVNKELGGGGILDVGVYTVQFVQYVYRGYKPIKFVGSGQLNEHGTDDTAGAIITYSDDKIGIISCSTKALLPNEAIIIGTKGMIRIPTFWCPTKMITPEKTFEYELPKTKLPINFHNGGGMAYEAEEVRRCINLGLLESPRMPHSETLELSSLLDLYRKQVGVIYDEDDL